MKKIFLLSFVLASLLSCEQAVLVPENEPAADEFYASIEAFNLTKTSMDENNSVLWSEGDQVLAFAKNTRASKYQIKEQYIGYSAGGFGLVTGPNGTSTFEPGEELDHHVLLYPYSDEVECKKNDENTPTQSYSLNITLAEEQSYVEDSFGNGTFPMLAVSGSTKLAFKNICGGLKLQFKGVDKVKSIKLEGLDKEKLAGMATVVGYADGSNPVVTMASNAVTSITLDCGEGVQLDETNPTTFILAVPPVTFASGMKITVTDTDGYSRTLINSSENTIRRSSLLTFPVITYQQEGVFEIPEGAVESFDIPTDGGDVEIPIVTNQDYDVVIPAEASDWISVVETKAVREETITLNIEPNTTSEARSAEIIIASTAGEPLQTITISQEVDNTLGNKTYSLGAVVGGAYWERFLMIDNNQYDIVVPSEDCNWCSSSIAYDANGNRCVYIIVYNNPGEARSTVISVTNTSDNTTYEITIDQEAASENDEKYLIFTNNEVAARNNLSVKYPQNSFQEIYSNIDISDLTITIPEDAQSWLIPSLTYTSVEGKLVLMLNAKTNTGPSRNAIIEIQSASNSHLILRVNVIQDEGQPIAYVDANGNDCGAGIEIDGVIWAPVNVGAFVSSDYGSYYTWLAAHNACPDGWRLPTISELKSLATNYEWTVQDEVNGCLFYGSSSSNTPIFLPAAGNSTGTVQWGYAGYYHSITQSTTPSTARNLTFTSTAVETSSTSKDSGEYSVRCVLVSDEEAEETGITIDGLTWMTKNLGAEKISNIGNHYTTVQSSTVCPTGWRLPTIDEYNVLALNSRFATVDNVNGYWLSGSNTTSNANTGIFLPLGSYYYRGNDGINEYDDETIYLTSTKETYTVGFCMNESGFSTYDSVLDGPHFMPIRCVKGTQTLPYINASVQSVEVTYEGVESQVITLSSNVSVFNVEVPEAATSWIQASVSGRKLTVTVSENTGYPRSASIRVSYANNPSYYTDIPVNQEGLVEFNENYCIYYRENKTQRSSGDNFYLTRSYVDCQASGSTVEMKFKLSEISSYPAYLGSGSNRSKDSCDKLIFTSTGLSLYVYNSEDDYYDYSWTWSEMGVTSTDLITLVFSGADETITINGKVLSCEGISNLYWSYVFSSYFRDSDDGVYETYDTIPDGSQLYYVKMYDENGNMTYFGHAAKLKNSTEYCWYSTKNGTATCQYANDYANQGGYEGNF